MKLQNRNGVLGLETAKQVMVAFLILSVTAVAVLLSLTALDDSVGDTIDNTDFSKTTTNETEAWINQTGYTLSNSNSSTSSHVITIVYNATNNGTGIYSLVIGTGNYTVSTVGVLSNITTTTWENVSVSYTFTYTVDSGTLDSIIGNVSAGLVTFFASTGTIFSILIVVVIILAISIIIWAVGRFGQQTEGTVDL